MTCLHWEDLRLVSAENLFVNAKLRLGLSRDQISKLRLFFISNLRCFYEYGPMIQVLVNLFSKLTCISDVLQL